MFLKKRVNVDQTNLYKQAYTYLAADNSFLHLLFCTHKIFNAEKIKNYDVFLLLTSSMQRTID